MALVVVSHHVRAAWLRVMAAADHERYAVGVGRDVGTCGTGYIEHARLLTDASSVATATDDAPRACPREGMLS